MKFMDCASGFVFVFYDFLLRTAFTRSVRYDIHGLKFLKMDGSGMMKITSFSP